MSENMQQCWDWLNDHKNGASAKTEFNKDGTYKQHRVVWYVSDFGWCDATGQSLEEAILNAINTRVDFETDEYFVPKKEGEHGSH
jgi:hypothetical protein